MTDYIDLTRFEDINLAFDHQIATPKYTFETWIYSQTYLPGQFGTYSFIWNRYLKIVIEAQAPNYSSTCYPIHKEEDGHTDVNSNKLTFQSDALPWVYLRCSVNIGTKKYFHFKEKSFTSELELTTSLTDILAGNAYLKFVNASKNRGVLFFRLLRLWDCYDCQPVDTYKINWINVDIIQSQIANDNLLYHVDGKIRGYDTIDRTDNAAETKQKIKYIKNSTGVLESGYLTPLSASDFLGYNVIDITTSGKYNQLSTPQSTNHLCPENTYFCSGLVKVNQVEDVNIASVTPSLSGKYTIEFWTMISDVTSLTNGFHIIWKNLASVTVISDTVNTGELNTICWPQDFKFEAPNVIEGTFGVAIHTLVSGATIVNKEKKTRTSDINNKWLYVRCAVNTEYKKFYSVLEDETVTIPTEIPMTGTDPMSHTFNTGDTTYVLLSGMSSNSNCIIYLRNLWLYSNYLLPNNNTRNL